MGIDFKGILVILLLFLPNVLFYIFPPQTIPQNLSSAPAIFTVLEQAGRILCLAVPIVFGKKIAEQHYSWLVILMAACLLVYYVLLDYIFYQRQRIF